MTFRHGHGSWSVGRMSKRSKRQFDNLDEGVKSARSICSTGRGQDERVHIAHILYYSNQVVRIRTHTHTHRSHHRDRVDLR
jgi:hypothetical protein